jgi:hypothetical protein
MNVHMSMSILSNACILLILGCNSGPQGIYSDATRRVVLEFKSGGKASFAFLGDVQDCTYKNGGEQLTLSCKGGSGSMVFAIHNDGSLTGPPGSFMPPLRKQR